MWPWSIGSDGPRVCMRVRDDGQRSGGEEQKRANRSFED